MKIIFLDINGVLDSVESKLATDKRLGETKRFDPISIGLIKRLCETTGALIVITSTLRKRLGPPEFIKIFSNYNWPEVGKYFGGVTSVSGSNDRELEISLFLHDIKNSTKEDIEFIIIDDDSEDYVTDQIIARYLHVSNVNGFRVQHFCKALRMFGMPDERLEEQVNFKRTTDKGLQSLPGE